VRWGYKRHGCFWAWPGKALVGTGWAISQFAQADILSSNEWVWFGSQICTGWQLGEILFSRDHIKLMDP